MKPLVVFSAVILVGAIVLAASARPQQPDETSRSAADQVAELKVLLDQERVAREVLEKRLERIDTEMAAVLTWAAGLERATGVLSSAADAARQHGFEYAAPNPKARTDIIEGLKGFAAALLENRPAPRPPKKSAGGATSASNEVTESK